MPVAIESSRKRILKNEFTQPYFHDLVAFLKKEKSDKHIVYPPGNIIFRAFEYTPFDQVKVVILWQDPYHWVGQAMGLSFSVPENIPLPPSLQNIYKEIYNVSSITDVDDVSGDLSSRAHQGVLLLNAILTVRAEQPASHRKKWRETFTDAVIKSLSKHRTWIVFLLRWNYAKSKSSLIDRSKHHILTSVHPSPLSAHRGWFGCGHFDVANTLLESEWHQKINRK